MDRKKLMEKLNSLFFFWSQPVLTQLWMTFIHWIPFHDSVMNEILPWKNKKNPLDDSVVDEPKLAEFNLGGYNR
jgi:hypothetical protein